MGMEYEVNRRLALGDRLTVCRQTALACSPDRGSSDILHGPPCSTVIQHGPQ
jgi:hypothetical protein